MGNSKYLIITVDLFEDLGSRFVALTLLDLLFFRGVSPLLSLLLINTIYQSPSIFLAPIAGLYIDKFGAKSWLLFADIIKCVIISIFAFVSSMWIIYPIYFCFMTGSLFTNLARSSLVTILIPKKHLISFNSLSESISISAGIFAPWLTSLIISKTGQNSALLIGGFFFLTALFTITRIPFKSKNKKEPSTEPSVQKAPSINLFSEYKNLLSNNHNLATCFILLQLILLCSGLIDLGLPIFFKKNLCGDTVEWGLIMSVFQAGCFLGSIILPKCSQKIRGHILAIINLFVLSIATLTLTRITTYIHLAIIQFIFGCGFTMLTILVNSLIQQYSPKTQIGKVMSLINSSGSMCFLSISFFSAFVIELIGITYLFILGALIFLTAAYWLKNNPIDIKTQCV